ncbi:MAG: hypothetical protein RLZZ584_3311 [Pseudomonadota bacterium]
MIGLLGGCAAPPIKPIELSDSVYAAKSARVGVVLGQLPKVDTQFPGAGCLLCLAAASVANSKLTAHVQTLGAEDLPKVKDDLVKRLRARGLDAVAIDTPIDIEKLAAPPTSGDAIARRDFSALKATLHVDKLLVIEVNALGVWRNYSAYIPTGDPKAVLLGAGYLVNLTGNTLEWYRPVNIMKSADQQWDEPPNFPGLTNAYFQALELGKDEFTSAFAR